MFGKKVMEAGERVLVLLEADVKARSVTVLGQGTYEGLFHRGDVESTEPVARSEALKLVLGGKSMGSRIRLDSGEVCWGDEVHWGDLAGGLEWLGQFVDVKTTTMAEVKAEARAKTEASADTTVGAERLLAAAPQKTNWRVEPEVDVRSWRCGE